MLSSSLEYPHLFFHGYYVLIATFLLNFVALGTQYSTSILLPTIEQTFHSNRAITSFIPSIQVVAALTASFLSGYTQSLLSRRLNLGVGWMFGSGGISLALGYVMGSRACTLRVLIAWNVLVGWGLGWTGYIAGGICVQWFIRKRGRATLLAEAGMGMGNFVYVRVVGRLLECFGEWLEDNRGDGLFHSFYSSVDCGDGGGQEGWRAVMFMVGSLSGMLAILASFVMRLPRNLEVKLHEISLPELDTTSQDDGTDREGGRQERERVSFIGSREDNDYGSFLSADIVNGKSTRWKTKKSKHSPPEYDAIVDIDDTDDGEDEQEQSPVTFRSFHLTDSTVAKKNTRRRTHNSKHASLHLSVKTLNTSLCTLNHIQNSVQHKKGLPNQNSKYSSHKSFFVPEYTSLAQLPVDQSLLITKSEKYAGDDEILTFTQTLWTRTTLSLLAWQICLSFSLMAFYEHLPAFAESIGLTTVETGYILSLSGLAMLLGNLTLGLAIDYFGAKVVFRVVACILASVMFLWPHCKTIWTLRAMASIYGFCTVICAFPLVVLAETFGDAAPSSILFIAGILNACSIPGNLFGPSVVGYLYSVYRSYVPGSAFTGVCMVVGIVAIGCIPATEKQMEHLGIQ